MGPINFLLTSKVQVKRRPNSLYASRDSLNNPVYGSPTLTWKVVYTDMPVRFAFSQKKIQFDPMGERIKPYGVMYYSQEFTLQFEDRIITDDGIEYVVTAISYGNQAPGIVSHVEAQVELP